ncbi:MAG: type II secretion system F family protein [Sulfuricellaceae bacterium]|jgi:type IV pilus assembly protein PilC
MTLFLYKAVDAEGKVIRGQLDAANDADLDQRLERLGLELIEVREQSAEAFSLIKRRVRRQDLITFCFHLEQLTRAGVPLLEGLADLRDSLDHPQFRQIIANVLDEVEGGKMLSEALAMHPAVFDSLFVNLVRAGEQSGRLPEIFGRLTESLKWQDEMIAQAKKAVMYPAFVGVVVSGVLFFMMIYLVPQLVSFMKNMGQELPLHTRILIAVSNFFVHYWYGILMAPLVAFAAVKIAARRSPAFRYRLDGLKLRLWLVGPILKKIALARFASFLGLLYNSGISMLQALKICEGIANNAVIAGGIAQAGRQIGEGQGITASFQNTGLFPPLVIRMFKVGETTGALDTALANVSYFYDRDVKESIGRLQTLIEPALTVILGLLMGWIMLSVLGPIYDTISKLKV